MWMSLGAGVGCTSSVVRPHPTLVPPSEALVEDDDTFEFYGKYYERNEVSTNYLEGYCSWVLTACPDPMFYVDMLTMAARPRHLTVAAIVQGFSAG
jgi:hypothetical protein